MKEEIHGGDFDQGNSLKQTISVFDSWWLKNKKKFG